MGGVYIGKFHIEKAFQMLKKQCCKNVTLFLCTVREVTSVLCFLKNIWHTVVYCQNQSCP